SAPSPPTLCRQASWPRRPPRRRSSRETRAASAYRIRGRSACPGTRGFSSCLPPVPLRVPDFHSLAARFQRMALIELEGLGAVFALFLALAGVGLDRRGRQSGQHLGQMGTAPHVAEEFPHALAKAAQQVQADQLAIRRRDLFATARI